MTFKSVVMCMTFCIGMGALKPALSTCPLEKEAINKILNRNDVQTPLNKILLDDGPSCYAKVVAAIARKKHNLEKLGASAFINSSILKEPEIKASLL